MVEVVVAQPRPAVLLPEGQYAGEVVGALPCVLFLDLVEQQPVGDVLRIRPVSEGNVLGGRSLDELEFGERLLAPPAACDPRHAVAHRALAGEELLEGGRLLRGHVTLAGRARPVLQPVDLRHGPQLGHDHPVSHEGHPSSVSVHVSDVRALRVRAERLPRPRPRPGPGPQAAGGPLGEVFQLGEFRCREEHTRRLAAVGDAHPLAGLLDATDETRQVRYRVSQFNVVHTRRHYWRRCDGQRPGDGS